jgi:hypothetical protein
LRWRHANRFGEFPLAAMGVGGVVAEPENEKLLLAQLAGGDFVGQLPAHCAGRGAQLQNQLQPGLQVFAIHFSGSHAFSWTKDT